jgi:hypothetical protein
MPEIEAFNLGLNHGSKHPMTTTVQPLGEQLCLMDFDHASDVAAWLRSGNAALLAPFKDDTFFNAQDQRRAAALCMDHKLV